jgi:HEAT repeat protein
MIDALAAVGPDSREVLETLTSALDDRYWSSHTLQAMVRMGNKAPRQAIPKLLELFNEDRGAQFYAAQIFANIGADAKAAVPALVRSLRTSQDVQVRWSCARALGKLPVDREQWANVTGALLYALENDHWYVGAGAAEALVDLDVHRHPPSARRIVRRMLWMVDWRCGREPFDVLARLGPIAQEATPAIIRELSASNIEYERALFVSVLGKIGAPAGQVVPALTRALRDKEPVVRAAAAGALATVGEPARSTIPELRQVAAHDADATVRKAAEEALRKLQSVGQP